jgi:hypothetical protein
MDERPGDENVLEWPKEVIPADEPRPSRISNPTAVAFFERLRDARESTKGSSHRLAQFLLTKTFLHGQRYSFKGHEYQQAIADCDASVVSTIKPSQVGLSELSARLCLATLATAPGVVALYTGPSLQWVQTFVKSRVDAVIYESPTLREALRPGSDSSRLKIIGTSQLHTAGLYGGNPVISIPVDTLFIDELDFCSEESIRTAESRLSHSRFVDPETGVRGLRRVFSTPTSEEVGISAWYDRSDKRKRLCRCYHCTEWFWPGEIDLIHVKGVDRAFSELTSADVVALEKRGLVDEARLRCPKCKTAILTKHLQPQYREWVAERPEIKGHAGFWVDVFSVPDYHTPASILRKLVLYGHDVANFRNFTLGHPYSDASNSVLAGLVETHSIVTPVPPDVAVTMNVRGCYLGLDVGKTSHVVIAKVVGEQRHILWMEQIKLNSADGQDLVDRVLYLCKAYHVCFGGMDAYPYSDSCHKILNSWPALRAVSFTLRDKTLPLFLTKEKEISANRTKLLDLTVKKVNSGVYRYPSMAETAVFSEHLRAVRKIKREKESGDVVDEWVSSKADHYMFALAYLTLSMEVIEEQFVQSFAAPATIRQAIPGKAWKPRIAA